MGNFYNNAVLTPFFFDKEYDYSDGTITDIPKQLAQEAKSDNVFIGRYVKVLAPGKYNQSIWQKVLDSDGMRYDLVADLDSPADEVIGLQEEITNWFDNESDNKDELGIKQRIDKWQAQEQDEINNMQQNFATWFDHTPTDEGETPGVKQQYAELESQTENLQKSLTSIKLNKLEITPLENDAGTEVIFTLTAQTINAATGSAQDNPQSVSATMTVNNKIFWQEF